MKSRSRFNCIYKFVLFAFTPYTKIQKIKQIVSVVGLGDSSFFSFSYNLFSNILTQEVDNEQMKNNMTEYEIGKGTGFYQNRMVTLAKSNLQNKRHIH